MFTAPHQYVSVIGDAYAGPERWQFGLRITDGGIDNLATAQAIAPIVRAFWEGTGAWNLPAVQWQPSATHRLTEVKVARVDVNGIYPPTEASASVFFVPAVSGTTPALVGQAPQLATCVSLQTALPRGLGSKGRIYLPPNARMNSGNSGAIATNMAQVYADAVALLVGQINAQALIGNVAVFSRGKAERGQPDAKGKYHYTYPNPGATNNVTGVRCGNVVDTQRRRRRQLVETYVSKPVL